MLLEESWRDPPREESLQVESRQVLWLQAELGLRPEQGRAEPDL